MVSWIIISFFCLLQENLQAEEHQIQVNQAIKETYINQEQAEIIIEAESRSQDPSSVQTSSSSHQIPVPSTNNSMIQVDQTSTDDRCWNSDLRSRQFRQMDPEGDILTLQYQNDMKNKHDDQVRDVYFKVVNERLKKAKVRLPSEVSRELESRIYGHAK